MQRGLLGGLVIAALLAVWWFGFHDGAEPEAATSSLGGADEAASESEESPPAKASMEAGPALEAKGHERMAEAPAPTAAPEPPPENSVTVTGRVLDERRRPVAGAVVSIVDPQRLAAQPLTGTTDAAGHYRIAGLLRPESWVFFLARARHGELAGQVGVTIAMNTPENLTLPVMVMGPSHSLVVRVKRADGSPAADARVLLESRHMWRTAVIADARADQAGSVRFEGLTTGSYRVHGLVRGAGRGTSAAHLPQRKVAPVTITVGPERALVAIVVDKDTGAPVAGARLKVNETIRTPAHTLLPWVPAMTDLRTDAQGRATIPGLSTEAVVQVVAEADGYSDRSNYQRMGGIAVTDTEVRIELQKTRRVRWPLAAENPHAPAEGTKLEFIQARGAVTGNVPTSAWIEDGHIVAEGCSASVFHSVALAPSGAFARLMALPQGGKVYEATFARPRKITVILKQADGSPAKGYYISVRNQGNNVIVDPTPLGPDGSLEMELRYQHLVDVFASPTPQSYGGTALGSVNLKEEGGGTIESTLPEGRVIELRVLIDGEARLPAHYSLGFGAAGGLDIEEDPSTGTLRMTLPGRGAMKLPFTARGFLGQTLDLAAAEGSKPTKLDVVLARGGHVLLRIKPPAKGRHRVSVSKAGQPQRGFAPPMPGRSSAELGMENGWILRRLGPYAPGEYEATDSSSKARSDAFTVKTGEETTVSLDLSRVGTVKGRVVLPEGYDVRQVRVSIAGKNAPTGPMARYAGAGVGQDGTFQIRVPGNRAVTLVVRHPQLIPASPGGHVTLTEPREDVVLELVAGGVVTFKVDPSPPAARRPGQSAAHVFLYKGEVEGKADHDLQATRAEDTFSVGGFKPGTYTVVVYVPGRAPALLGSMKLGATTDLGVVRTPEGATIRFKLQVKEGQDPPRVFAQATAKSGPLYYQFINSRGEAEVVLKGLGAGTFDVSVRSMRGFGAPGAGGTSVEKAVESDGRSEIVVEIDLR